MSTELERVRRHDSRDCDDERGRLRTKLIKLAELRPSVVAYLADLISEETHDAEMLEALKDLESAVTANDILSTTKALFKADAVIRKAEGR